MTFGLSKTDIIKNRNIEVFWDPKERKTYTDTVKNTFLHKLESYLELSLQKVLLELFCSQTISFDFCENRIIKIYKIRVIWLLKKENFTHTV